MHGQGCKNFFIPKTTTRYESEGIYQTHKSSQIINTQTSRVFSPSSYEFWENPVISYDFMWFQHTSTEIPDWRPQNKLSTVRGYIPKR